MKEFLVAIHPLFDRRLFDLLFCLELAGLVAVAAVFCLACGNRWFESKARGWIFIFCAGPALPHDHYTSQLDMGFRE